MNLIERASGIRFEIRRINPGNHLFAALRVDDERNLIVRNVLVVACSSSCCLVS